MATNGLRPASNRRYKDYSVFLNPDDLIRDVRLDLQDASKSVRELEKQEHKDRDALEKIAGYKAKLRNSWKISDYRQAFSRLNTLVRQYSNSHSPEVALALRQATDELESNLITLHSVRVAQADALLHDPSSQTAYKSRVAVNLANKQISRRSYTDGTPAQLQNTSFRNRVFGYDNKASPARKALQRLDELNSPEKMAGFYKTIPQPSDLQKIVSNSAGSPPVIVIPTPPITGNASAAQQVIHGTMNRTYVPPKKALSVWDYKGKSPAVTNSIYSPSYAALGNITGIWPPNIPSKRIYHQYSSPIGPNQIQGPVAQIRKISSKQYNDYSSIAKSLELLYRPIINLVKGIGDIAAEAKKMELAMSSLATALGNPFDEATLSGISGFGSAGISTSIGGAGAIGGAISGVGGGIGRMANDTWNLRGKGLTDAQNKGLSKAGGVLAAVSAALGIVGAAIGAVTSTVSAGFSISTSLLKSLNKTTLKILGTSPLLETIKNILNLAFTMAFLPAMTLLEGQILPVVLDLLNTMVNFGNTFTKDFNKYIPEIVNSFGKVFKVIGDFFSKNSQKLATLIYGMIQLLPDMMKMQLGIIELFVNNKDKILDVAQKTIDVLGTFIEQGLFEKLLIFAENTMGFLGKWGIPMASAVLDLANFIVGAADVAASWTDDWFGLKHSLAEAADGLSFWTDMAEGWDSWWSKHGFANGGYVPATPGGVPAIIGEGGEGEYIIPESKLNSIGGLTVVFSGNVYGMNDFKQQVRSIMNEYTTKANFR